MLLLASHLAFGDLNTAFLAAAARLVVGLSAPDHFHRPVFNPKIPGSWLVDLSHIDADPRLPSPFTPDGTRPTGPAWCQSHTVAHAEGLGYNVSPLEAYLRRETGAYLDPWHDRLKNAYVDTLADLGVTDAESSPPSRPPSRAASASCVNAPRASATRKANGGRPPNAPPGAPTSVPPSSPGPESTCTARCATWPP